MERRRDGFAPHLLFLGGGGGGIRRFSPPIRVGCCSLCKGMELGHGARLESQDRSLSSCLRDQMPSSCLQLTLCG